MTDSDVAASPAPKPAKPKFSWRVWAVVSMFGAIAYALMFSTAEGKPFPLAMLVPFSIFGGAMVGFIYYGLFHVLRVFFYSTREGQNAQKAAETLQDQLDTDFVTDLVKINFKYIDKYYLQTQVQAEKSFLMSAVAAFVGLVMICVGVAFMAADKASPAYIATGSGLLTQFISAVFFYLYNQTVLRMGEYHQKLVITQNVSIALKISEGLPRAEKVISQQRLIASLADNVNLYLIGAAPNVERKFEPKEKTSPKEQTNRDADRN